MGDLGVTQKKADVVRSTNQYLRVRKSPKPERRKSCMEIIENILHDLRPSCLGTVLCYAEVALTVRLREVAYSSTNWFWERVGPAGKCACVTESELSRVH